MPVFGDLCGGGFCRVMRVASAMLVLVACAPRQIDVESLATGADRRICPATALQEKTGRPFTALAEVPLPDGLRILRPGQTVTRDLQPRRLNAQVDDAGRILRLFCG